MEIKKFLPQLSHRGCVSQHYTQDYSEDYPWRLKIYSKRFYNFFYSAINFLKNSTMAKETGALEALMYLSEKFSITLL